MLAPSNFIALPLVVLVSALAGISVIPGADRPFMDVHSLEYVGGIVTADRTIAAPSAVADWRVTVVGTDDLAPTCNTIPGMGKHEGWSPYQAGRSVTEMDIDTWVGQAGCYDTLTPGEYTMFVNWTPRDGREPAYTSLTFMK